jgi:hypothetical protein
MGLAASRESFSNGWNLRRLHNVFDVPARCCCANAARRDVACRRLYDRISGLVDCGPVHRATIDPDNFLGRVFGIEARDMAQGKPTIASAASWGHSFDVAVPMWLAA